MDIFIAILKIIAGSIVMLVIYNVLKVYVLPKVKINKWIVLAAAILLFIVPIVWPTMPGYVRNYVIPGIIVVLFLWFMDLSGFIKKRSVPKTNYTNVSSKKDNKKDIVMRPKAKPNRVRNFKK